MAGVIQEMARKVQQLEYLNEFSGVLNSTLDTASVREKALQANAKADERRCVPGAGCLTMCGLRDGVATAGQFCISQRLADAVHGRVGKGLFFRGSEPLPFGSAIRPVAELFEYLLAS